MHERCSSGCGSAGAQSCGAAIPLHNGSNMSASGGTNFGCCGSTPTTYNRKNGGGNSNGCGGAIVVAYDGNKGGGYSNGISAGDGQPPTVATGGGHGGSTQHITQHTGTMGVGSAAGTDGAGRGRSACSFAGSQRCGDAGTGSTATIASVTQIEEDDVIDPQVERLLNSIPPSESGVPDFWSTVGAAQTNGVAGGEDFPPPSPYKADKKYDPRASLDWLDGSCWSPRKTGSTCCDARDYFDSRECNEQAFESDWLGTSGGAEGDGKLRPFGQKALVGEPILAIKEKLHQWYPAIIRIFMYYSCIGAETSKSIHGMTYTAFGQFLTDARLIKDTNSRREVGRHARLNGEDGWDLLWVTINSSRLSTSQQYNSKTFLSRSEWLEFIVRAAISDGPLEAVSQGVHDICEDILKLLARHPFASTILHNPDVFRRMYCYRHEVCAVLDHHEQSLRSVFGLYSFGGISCKMMSCEEWNALMSDVGFIKELTYRRVFVTFAQARMLTIEEGSKRSQVGQLHQLTYEGFLEAIIRLSVIKAIPTDKEMKRAGFQYPGEFIGALLDQGLTAYNNWRDMSLKVQVAGGGDPIWRKVDMLILLIVSIVQYGVEKQPGGAKVLIRGHPDEVLTEEEVKLFKKKPTPYVFETANEASA